MALNRPSPVLFRSTGPALAALSAVLLAAVVSLVVGVAAASTTADKLDTLMHDLVNRNLFQGAVVVGTRGRIDYAAGFGFADIERQIPFTPDTPTDGGSMAKTFTAAALLQLATEQRVDQDSMLICVSRTLRAGTSCSGRLGLRAAPAVARQYPKR